jgi:hypothetical protein
MLPHRPKSVITDALRHRHNLKPTIGSRWPSEVGVDPVERGFVASFIQAQDNLTGVAKPACDPQSLCIGKLFLVWHQSY